MHMPEMCSVVMLNNSVAYLEKKRNWLRTLVRFCWKYKEYYEVENHAKTHAQKYTGFSNIVH